MTYNERFGKRLRIWLVEWVYRRKLRRLTHRPTFYADTITLYEYKMEDEKPDWFLCMEGEDLQMLLPVNKDILHTLVKDLNESVGLSFVEFEG